MTTRQRRIVALAARGYGAFVRSLAPALWFRMNELSGAAINSGALGATYNGTYTACTLAQPGKMSPTGAVLFDGVNSLLTVPAGPFGNYAAMSMAALVNVSSAGEGSLGTLADWGSSTTFRFYLALAAIEGKRAATGGADSISTSGIGAGTWAWVFWTYANAGDRKIRLYKGTAGTVTELGYSTQGAATGTMTNQSGTNLSIGNRSNQSQTLAGLYDEFLLFDKVLTTAQMSQIVRLTGV